MPYAEQTGLLSTILNRKKLLRRKSIRVLAISLVGLKYWKGYTYFNAQSVYVSTTSARKNLQILIRNNINDNLVKPTTKKHYIIDYILSDVCSVPVSGLVSGFVSDLVSGLVFGHTYFIAFCYTDSIYLNIWFRDLLQ